MTTSCSAYQAMIDCRHQTLQAAAAGKKQTAYSWRLTADEIAIILRQQEGKTILCLNPTLARRTSDFSHDHDAPHASLKEKHQFNQFPFIDGLARLAQSTQEAHYRLQNDPPPHWLFRKEASEESLSCYRYWMAYATVSSSKNVEQEMQQATAAAQHYHATLPKAAAYAQQAALFFKKANHLYHRDSIHSSLSHELAVHRWRIAAQEAAYLAYCVVQETAVAQEKEEFFFQASSIMDDLAEQTLTWRVKAAEATEQNREEQALHYSLAAGVTMRLVEKLETMKVKASLTLCTSSSRKPQQDYHEILEAVSLVQKSVTWRVSLIREISDHDFLKRYWEHAAYWLENALDAYFKKLETEEQGYKALSAYWNNSYKTSQETALLYTAITSTTLSWLLKWRLKCAEKRAQEKIPLMLLEKVSFCLSENYLPSAAWRERWEKGKIVSFDEKNKSMTVHAWIYQTWSLLQRAGIACDLFPYMPHLPTHGIFVTLSGFLHHFKIPTSLTKNRFLVDIIADAGTPHPAALLHLVPNKATALHALDLFFMPHWPQPFLIPRSATRGNDFKNICYLGDIQSIAPELCSPEWKERLKKELGLHFSHRESGCWHDFHDIDCVVAIRDFSSSRYFYKPASKLYNAWLAGVPFIGGHDSAYAAHGRAGYDYLKASSAEELFQHLKHLKEDLPFRTKLIEKGFQSGRAFTQEATCQYWKKFLEETLPVRAQEWQHASTIKQIYLLLKQQLFCWIPFLLNYFFESKKYQLLKGVPEKSLGSFKK